MLKTIIRKQEGITLVELLATLAILSFLLSLLYGVFFSGLNYAQQGKNKVTMQQESNYITALLTSTHQTEQTYTIDLDLNPAGTQANSISVITEDGTTTKISNSQFSYVLNATRNDGTWGVIDSLQITPHSSTQSHFQIELIIIDNTSGQRLEVSTILSRIYKGS